MRPDTPTPITPATPAGTDVDRKSHLDEAARLEHTARRYPEDAEQLLLRAAAHHELADNRERATALYDGLLAAESPEDPVLIRALKAANLWEYGHEAEARAIITGVRSAAARTPAPWIVVGEALEAHDELQEAHDTFTEGTALLVEAATPPPYETRPLLFGRHRVRRLLGAPHDDWDTLADTLNTAALPLDELHDPNRTWSLGSDNPEELRAEITRIQAELGTYRAALSRPYPVAVLHWPAAELTELLASYPGLSSEYPADHEHTAHEIHTAAVESALRDLTASGTPNLGTVEATVPSYEAFAAAETSHPTDPHLLPLYTTTLATRARSLPWPPETGAPCWCGSGRGYGGCHGVGR